jgi:ABC-2 type transport system ATP-binding protein/lipopolysaccharide transport system ATP-binding protein
MRERVILKDVTVDFPIYDVTARSLRHTLVINRVSNLVSRSQNVGGTVRRDGQGVVVVRALDNINFTLDDGDRVAIVGHNGAGKTTLLRVAAGIYEPLVGSVDTYGRVMPLFNIMEGLTPDATGREIIRVRGALLGLSDRDIDEKSDEIMEFCELGEYIEMPVRTYSTGMVVRLMFAITTAVTSEILIMDEFIGAGDAAFFERAQARLKRFVDQASVLLVATHSPSVAREWCNKAILLDHGRIVEYGPVEPVLAEYDRLAKEARS